MTMRRIAILVTLLLIAAVPAFLVPAVRQAREARERAKTLSNLKGSYMPQARFISVVVDDEFRIQTIDCPRDSGMTDFPIGFYKPMENHPQTLELFEPPAELLAEAEELAEIQIAKDEYFKRYDVPATKDVAP